MSTYGSKEANYFKALPNDQYGKNLQNLNYSVTIDDENSTTPGKITIFSSVPNNPTTIKEIGTIPKGESFSPNPGQTTSTELQYFSQPNVITSVREHAKIVTEKSLYDLGVTDYQQRSQIANNLISQQTPAPDPSDPLQQPTANPIVTSSIQNAEPIDVQIGESKGRRDFGKYCYPLELKTNKQDRIIFTLKEVTGSRITPSFTERSVQRRVSNNIQGQVTLPIQPSITDSNGVDWSGGRLNALESYGAAASLTLMNQPGAPELIGSMQQILGDVANQAKQQGDALKLYLAQEAMGIQGLVSRATGAVLNPNLELLFNGPQLRPFNFTFRLSPREEKEATQVRSIIRFFKEAMSVRTTDSNVFLKSPLVFDIKYVTYNNEGTELPDSHPSISRIKTCALLSCDVDYTPDGSYMTFNDGTRTMTSYGLSLRFSELEPIYSTDYTGNNIPTDHIGF